jgi:hypothetical protein
MADLDPFDDVRVSAPRPRPWMRHTVFAWPPEDEGGTMTFRRSPRSARGATSNEHGGDRVPDEVVAQAKAAFATRTTGPLAALVFDSAVDENRPNAQRQLRFEYPSVTVEVAVAVHGRWRKLHGRVHPGQFRVEVELAEAQVTVAESADNGDFSFAGVPNGVMRLRLLERTGSNPVHTDWFRA